jgi:transposase
VSATLMTKIRSMVGDQSIMGEPERRGDERSEAPRSGGSPMIERAAGPRASDPEVPARHPRRRFTTAYKLEILRKAEACTRAGDVGALLRREGLYSSHLVTWRRQRERGLTPKKRGRKPTSSDPRLAQLEREKTALETTNRRLERRLQRAETIILFQKKVAELLGIPLKPVEPDEIE